MTEVIDILNKLVSDHRINDEFNKGTLTNTEWAKAVETIALRFILKKQRPVYDEITKKLIEHNKKHLSYVQALINLYSDQNVLQSGMPIGDYYDLSIDLDIKEKIPSILDSLALISAALKIEEYDLISKKLKMEWHDSTSQKTLNEPTEFSVSLCRAFKNKFSRPCYSLSATAATILFDLDDDLSVDNVRKAYRREVDRRATLTPKHPDDFVT